MTKHSSEELCQVAVAGLQEKKGENICIIDLRNIKNAIADYFVIASGNSDTHLSALSDAVEEEIHNKFKAHPSSREGKANGEWILLDYVDIIVHVFKKDIREHFALEELWGDAKITYIDN